MKSKEELLMDNVHKIKFKPNVVFSQGEINASFEGIKDKIDRSYVFNDRTASRFRFFSPTIYKLAGSLAILLSIGFLGYRYYNEQRQIIFANSSDVAKELTMPDGTKVWLRSESAIIYHQNYSSNRSVELTGEAFFEVIKDKEHPFNVKTKLGKITVLGTTFSVRAYENEGFTRTILKEGSVNFTDAEDKNAVILKPGEEATLQKGSENMTVKKVENIDRKLTWQSHNFIFENEPLSQIVSEIGGAFNKKIQILDTNLANQRYTLKFNRGESLTKILDVLSDVAEFKYKQEKSNLIIEKN